MMADQQKERAIMKQEMLINVTQAEECRIAIIEEGVLEELYVERTSQENLVGNIYKGRVVNIEPSIQAAFVDFGVGRNGFLHISDIEPQYYRQGGLDPDKAFELTDPAKASSEGLNNGGRPPDRRRKPRMGDRPRIKPPIQDVLKRGTSYWCRLLRRALARKDLPYQPTYLFLVVI